MNNARIKELWPRAALWLLFLGPFFFITYGWANNLTAARTDISGLVLWWEHKIPFLPWTIIPYWSIDLLYGISLFICASRRELNIHALRLLAASLICCLCFIIFPMEFTFIRPASGGIFGQLFTALESFDLPYNQAPSLHIALAWIIWLRFIAHIKGRFWRAVCGCWFLLIAASVLTTWQHHFIDLPTGFFTGVLITYLLPINTRWEKWRGADKKQSYKLASFYIAGAIISSAAAVCLKGYFWLLLWPAAALFFVALGYIFIGPCVFQKTKEGKLSPSSKILFAPYRVGAWLSYLYLSAKAPEISQITSLVFIGSLPRKSINQDFLLDMTAEFDSSSLSKNNNLICLPRLDLLPPSAQEINEAVKELDKLHKKGSALVFCALGLSRSVLAAAAWLIASKQAGSIEEAIKIIAKARPRLVLRPAHIKILEQWRQTYS